MTVTGAEAAEAEAEVPPSALAGTVREGLTVVHGAAADPVRR